MIHVDHSTVNQPDVLHTQNGPGQKETTKAIAYFGKTSAKGRPPKFKAYKHDSVKRTLETLFHGKCAYCESSYAATQPVDVEHWRPKARVINNSGKVLRDGYYWLAAQWTNLLPSCIDCNRIREHEILPATTRSNSGKGNLFPLEHDKHRAKKPGEESRESPLLLHPYLDEPSKHLRFIRRNERVIFTSNGGRRHA